MSKMVGTISRGVRAPIIREGDNLSEIVVDCVLEAAKSEPFEIRDKDVIAVTEAVVARARATMPVWNRLPKMYMKNSAMTPLVSSSRFSAVTAFPSV